MGRNKWQSRRLDRQPLGKENDLKEMRVEGNDRLLLVIPDDVDFSHLNQAYEPDGSIRFEWSPIEAICKASGIDIAVFQYGPEDNLAKLITAWYRVHRENGGAVDPVEEDLLWEVYMEDMFGGGISHAPGGS
jgi:hypothetical protein